MNDVGSLGEEAAKLLGAVEDWLRGARDKGAGTGADERSDPSAYDVFAEHEGQRHVGPECLICPICQLLALARSARPEAFEHVVDAVGSLLLAVRSVVEEHERSWSQRRRPSTVQRITIS
jgi:hypothetical protein